MSLQYWMGVIPAVSHVPAVLDGQYPAEEPGSILAEPLLPFGISCFHRAGRWVQCVCVPAVRGRQCPYSAWHTMLLCSCGEKLSRSLAGPHRVAGRAACSPPCQCASLGLITACVVMKRVDSGRSGFLSLAGSQGWGFNDGVAHPSRALQKLCKPGPVLQGICVQGLPGDHCYQLCQSLPSGGCCGAMHPKGDARETGWGRVVLGLPNAWCLCLLAAPLQRRMKPLASCLGLWLLFQLPSLVSGTRVVYKVQEEQPPNTLIGSLASDYGFPDVGHLYKLEVGAPYLRVDGKTGDIYTTETSIDRESLRECQHLLPGEPCFLEFEVSITDLILNSGPRLLEGQIEVLDINDNTPNFASPVLTLSIPENTNIGTLFPIPLAMDRDSGPNGVASYELTAGPEAQELFGLQVAEDQDEKQPQLIVMGNLDREQWDSYDLTIKVQDGGNPPRASSALLRITILDMNDNAPKFEKALYEAELSENSPVGHSVLQVSAGAFCSSPAPHPAWLQQGQPREHLYSCLLPWFLKGGLQVIGARCHRWAGGSLGCHI